MAAWLIMELGICHAQGIGEADGAGCDDVKLGSEASAGKSRRDLKLSKTMKALLEQFPKLQYCKPDPIKSF